MRNLSKSKLLAFRQCPKRLWLEIHRPELREDSAATQASFAVGHSVGDLAPQLYDPEGKGHLFDPGKERLSAIFAKTTELLKSDRPIFEAGFAAGGALALADVMLPVIGSDKPAWRMVEIKSSTSVKDYHRDDAAVQAFVARTAGVPLTAIALAHIDSSWVYPGDGDYSGLLLENDLTDEAFSRGAEVQGWIADAQSIAAQRDEPKIGTGPRCTGPYECGFLGHCRGQEPQAEYPVNWLPRIQSNALKKHITDDTVSDMRQVRDTLLNQRQQRVKACTLSGDLYFDSVEAAADLAGHELPAYFLDFESIQFAVPIWKGTRPYQQIPVQFSLHLLGVNGELEHQSFLDISGDDPSKAFAEALIAACGNKGPVFVYNAGFETARIKELGERFAEFKPSLLAINERVVDLLRIAEQRYYHPSQQGSWSIKKVLPAVAPDLSYAALDGVQDGGTAMNAFLEAIARGTTPSRKAQIEKQLLTYCSLDTFAMIRLWKYFSGRSEMKV